MLSNPFFYNYVFSEKDLKRAPISKFEYIFSLWWLCPTYTQISEGWIWYYKRKGDCYLFLKVEPLKEVSPRKLPSNNI